MRNRGKKIKRGLEAWLGKWLLRCLYGLNRWHVEGEHYYKDLLEKGEAVIISLWHGQLLAMFVLLAGKHFYGLAGTHRDADLIARVGEKIGWRFLRGSSKEKGLIAFKQIVNVLKQPGEVVIITPDGPQGPAHIPKPGAIRAAQLTGAAIVPMAAQSTRYWSFKNWDTFFVAKPFGRIEVLFGKPLYFSRTEDPQRCVDRLKMSLDDLTREVEKRVRD